MKKVIEKLAKQAHDSWSGWMKYLFSKSSETLDGGVSIPRSLVIRWKKQMETDYKDLPEEEKESDRDEARRYIAAVDLDEIAKRMANIALDTKIQ